MASSETSKESNQREELKIKWVPTEEIKKKYSEFFGDEIFFTTLIFETTEQEKQKEKNKKMLSAINVMSSAKYQFDMNRIIEGVKIAIKRDDLEKIKRAKARAIEKRLTKKETKTGESKKDYKEGR